MPASVKLNYASLGKIHQIRLDKKMAYVDAKSFSSSLEIKAPSLMRVLNICPRTALLGELDSRMEAHIKSTRAALSNCPEHLFSIDEDRLAAARMANG